MDIAISFDKNYLMPAGVMLTSLFENNKDTDIHIHVMYNGGGEAFVSPIADIVRKYNGRITCYDMSKYNTLSLPVNLPGQREDIPLESYFRLFLPDVLSPEIEKVLWLDCDIIVAHSLKDLWNEDISDYGLGSIPDFEHNNVLNMNRLEYDATYGYFNDGVLLINLKYWREKKMIPVFLNYIHDHYYELHFHDQDVLNHFFHQSKKVLSLNYNFQTTFLFKKEFRNISWKFFSQIDKYYKDPCVIHYTNEKPWFSDTTSPKKDIFIHYQDMTVWKGVVLKKKKTLKQKMKTWVAFHMLVPLYLFIRYKKTYREEFPYDAKYLN